RGRALALDLLPRRGEGVVVGLRRVGLAERLEDVLPLVEDRAAVRVVVLLVVRVDRDAAQALGVLAARFGGEDLLRQVPGGLVVVALDRLVGLDEERADALAARGALLGGLDGGLVARLLEDLPAADLDSGLRT